MKDFNKENYAINYISDISLKLPGYLLMFDLIFDAVLPVEFSKNPISILNIGAGEIELNHLLSMYPNSNIYVVDSSNNIIEYLKTKYSTKQIQYFNQTFDTFDIKESYNLIISLLVIHFIDDKKAFLNKIYNLLEDTGICIISAFSNKNMKWWKEFALNNGANQEDVLKTYLKQDEVMKSVDPLQIESYAKEIGFKKIEKISQILSIDLWLLQK